MTITYHQATEDDVENIIPLLIDMHGENALCSLDIDKTVTLIAVVVRKGLCLVAKDDDKIVGTIGLIKDSFWYSSDPVIMDKWFYVTPTYRKTRIALTLLKLVRQYANKNDMPLMLGVTTKVDAARKDTLYRGMAFYGSAWGENFP